jgi:hypothetical protein
MTSRRSSTDEAGEVSGLRRAFILLLALGCLLAAAAVFSQLYPVDQRGIKGTCQKLVGAAERRDPVALSSLLSPDYHDGRGFTRETAIQQLIRYLDARGFRHITPLAITVNDVKKGLAHATAKVWLAQADPAPAGHRDAVRLELSLRRESGSWRVTSVEDWELPAEDFDDKSAEE